MGCVWVVFKLCMGCVWVNMCGLIGIGEHVLGNVHWEPHWEPHARVFYMLVCATCA